MTAVAEHRMLCASRFSWLNEDTGQMEPVGLKCDCDNVSPWVLVPVPFIEKLKADHVAEVERIKDEHWHAGIEDHGW